MKNLFINLCLLAVVCFFTNDAIGQIRMPAASTTVKMETTVGLTDIMVQYSRPSVKGRTIFAADGLVPFGKIWRLGANSATKIEFSEDVKVAGQDVKAGAYAVLCKPNAGEWTFMMFPYESGSWASYREKTPAVTVSAKTAKAGRMVETFTIDINNVSNTGAHIDFLWEKTMVSLPLEVEVDSKVMKMIEATLGGPTAGDYYAAGTYYFESGKDLNKALEYVQKATHGENPRFWQVRREALILAELGKKKEAIEAAKKSLALAKDAGNEDYVRMNEKSIAEWSK